VVLIWSARFAVRSASVASGVEGGSVASRSRMSHRFHTGCLHSFPPGPPLRTRPNKQNIKLPHEVAFVRPEKEEQSDWLVWPNDSFHWPGVFILQTDAKSMQCFQKHAKLIENRFSRSKV
jgi:hypothetical protein